MSWRPICRFSLIRFVYICDRHGCLTRLGMRAFSADQISFRA